MLPAATRLRRRAEFVATVRAGRRRGHGAVVVHVDLADPITTAADAPVRVGFIVSRSVGNAVDRNRVRRRLRHLMRDRLGRLPAGASVVVRALPAAADRNHSELTSDLDAALSGAINARRRGGRSGPRRPNAAGPTAVDQTGPADSRHPTSRPAGALGDPSPLDHPVVPAAPGGSSRLAALWRRYGAVGMLRAVVVAYRRWVSPALPPRCRFHPTCSAYALEALETHGALRGLALTVWRLLRCHPFHPGGFDPVPPAPSRRPGATVTGAST